MVNVATLAQVRTVPNPVKTVVNPSGGYDVYQKGDTNIPS